MLIKRGNFYIHANFQKIKSNIFPVFYLFHRTCIKIPMILESVYDLICKIKHILLRPACLALAQVGPCAEPALSLSLQDADGEVPPVSFVFATHGSSATASATVGEGLGPRARAHQPRLAFATLLLPPNHTLSPSSHLGRANGGGRHDRSRTGH